MVRHANRQDDNVESVQVRRKDGEMRDAAKGTDQRVISLINRESKLIELCDIKPDQALTAS